jgi:TusA-related sulfurtransferase
MISTDAGSKSDCTLVKRTEHKLIEMNENGNEFVFLIKKMK